MRLAPEYRVGGYGGGGREPGDFIALVLRAVDRRHRGGGGALHDVLTGDEDPRGLTGTARLVVGTHGEVEAGGSRQSRELCEGRSEEDGEL